MKKGSLRAILRNHCLLTALFVLLVLFTMSSRALERMLIYFPTKTVAGNPAQAGLQFQELSLRTEDGIKLSAWFIPHPKARLTLLLFHGNAGNIGHRIPWIELLRPLEANVLIFDYRGYGDSEGSPYEQGLYRDAQAAYDWWYKERAPAEEGLVLVGESLGGAVAVHLAAKAPVAGLVVQSTFTSAWDMAKTLMPLGLLQPLARVHFDSAAKIGGVRCPKLFIHGSRDEIVPLRLGRKLFDLAPAPKQFYEVAEAGHNDLLWVAGQSYTERLRLFLAELRSQGK